MLVKNLSNRHKHIYLTILSLFVAACNNGSNCPTPSPRPAPTLSPSPSPSPSPVSCAWRQLGNASDFFNILPNSSGNPASPIILSPDGKKLYVGGYINYQGGAHLGVAEIDTTDGTSWTSVADSETIFSDTFVLNQLSSLAINSDSNELYLGGQYRDGERPVVYSSLNGGNWQEVQRISTNQGSYYEFYNVSKLIMVGNTLYASGYYGGNSFVASSTNDGEWAGVADSGSVFKGYSIYALLNNNGILYAAGESASTSNSALYKLVANQWQDISPMTANNYGTITSLAASSSTLYAGGATMDFTAMVLALPLGGDQWQNISTNFGSISWINSLQVYNDKLYAGGYIESELVSTPEDSINWQAVWDAEKVLDGPVSNIVIAPDGTIYADGEFSFKVAKLVCE